MLLLRGTMLVAVVLALLAPAAASAASKPGARTGGAANIAPSSVTLNGRVDPNRVDTTYFFQIGATSLYGVNTAVTPAGSGANPTAASAAVTGLAPATRYHYRVVAQNKRGLTKGADRTFKTKPQPLGFSLGANPNPTCPGCATTLAGQLSGTNGPNRDVVLQSNPFPYTQGFLNASNAQVTDGAGNFSFPVLSVPVTTQYRVVLVQRPEVASTIVFVGAALRVNTWTKKVERGRRGSSVRFKGNVKPQNDGGRVSIQKLVGGVWVEKAHTRAQDRGSSKSRYNTRVKIRRSGQFRVVAEAEGAYTSGAGRTITIKKVRRR